jgi:Circadian oscillating protein COP23
MQVNTAVRASLAIFVAFVLPVKIPGFAQARTPSVTVEATTFHCTSMPGGSYATVAKRGTRQTPPMIIWTSSLGEYGQYTPQRRCEIVSDKFTQAVARSGGKLKNMYLTYGYNNRQRVICYVNSRNGACNSDNQLFTLRPSDYGKERQILERLVNFGIHGTGTPVQQSGELYYANVGEEIEKFFATSTAQEPANTTAPVFVPKSPDTPANKESSI